ncbi:MAG: hypothetical protein CL927_15675 [Deltaproteobacteria bacterium]|nr:hypothetical protein [Deltaproteobacteria bacterium]HCH66968.1 hypothetical protein [Deltaproteobacteria bacterium]
MTGLGSRPWCGVNCLRALRSLRAGVTAMRAFGLLAAVAALGACQPATAPLERLDGGVGGCFSLVEERTCVTRNPGRVVVWVESMAPGLRLRGRTETAEVVEGGTRWSLTVEAPMLLEVEDAFGKTRFEVEIRPEAGPWRDAMYAGAGCEPEPANADPHVHAFWLTGRARCADLTARLPVLEQAIVAHRERGDALRADWDLAMWLNLAPTGAPVPDGGWLPSMVALESQYFWHRHFGMEANTAGNLADAHRYAARALAVSVVLNREEKRWSYADAVGELAETYTSAGRYSEALAVSTAALRAVRNRPGEDDSCATVMLLDRIAWFAILAKRPDAEIEAWLDEADAIGPEVRAACPMGMYRGSWHQTVNRALFLARAGRPEALDLMAEVDPNAANKPASVAWAWLTLAEAQLAAGRPVEVAGTLATIFRPGEPTPFQPPGRVLQARAWLAQGRPAAARAELITALDTIDRLATRAPLGRGRGSLVDTMTEASFLLATLHADAGDSEAAFAALRRHRRRALLGLHQASAVAERGGHRGVTWRALRQAIDTGEAPETGWDVDPTADTAGDSGDTGGLPPAVVAELERVLRSPDLGPAAPLRSPAPGELLVLAGRDFDGRVLLWWQRAGGEPMQQRLSWSDDSKTLSNRLVDRLTPVLARGIDRVTWLPIGVLRSLPLARGEWRGRPLGVQIPVVTSLDLGMTPAVPELGAAAVFADPTGDLVAARREGEAVASALGAATKRPLDVDLYVGRAASRDTMVALLESDVDLVHFAGHAAFSYDGWSSGLSLADGAQLAAWELLYLHQVPAVVSMTACESSRSEAGDTERVGLAQAFVLAGSRAVLAADVPIDDHLAGRYGRVWAQALAQHQPATAAWLSANQAVFEEFPEAPWWSFRLWSP